MTTKWVLIILVVLFLGFAVKGCNDYKEPAAQVVA